MSEQVQELARKFTDVYLATAPPDWVRFVIWAVRLADENGQPVEHGMKINRLIRLDEDTLVGGHARGRGASVVFDQIEAELGRTDPEWSQVRIERDRDESMRVQVSSEPRRPELDAATDPHWSQVHDYERLHSQELLGLAARLQESGHLAKPVNSRPRRGVLGYFRKP